MANRRMKSKLCSPRFKTSDKLRTNCSKRRTLERNTIRSWIPLAKENLRRPILYHWMIFWLTPSIPSKLCMFRSRRIPADPIIFYRWFYQIRPCSLSPEKYIDTALPIILCRRGNCRILCQSCWAEIILLSMNSIKYRPSIFLKKPGLKNYLLLEGFFFFLGGINSLINSLIRYFFYRDKYGNLKFFKNN